ncbi:hypothetical protein D3C85_1745430 [compost metagenome]
MPVSAFSMAKDIVDAPDLVEDLTGSTPAQIGNASSKMANDLLKQIKEMVLNGADRMKNGRL